MLLKNRQLSLQSLFVLITIFPVAMLTARAIGPFATTMGIVAFIAMVVKPPDGNPVMTGVSYFLIATLIVLLTAYFVGCRLDVLILAVVIIPSLAYVIGFAKTV